MLNKKILMAGVVGLFVLVVLCVFAFGTVPNVAAAEVTATPSAPAIAATPTPKPGGAQGQAPKPNKATQAVVNALKGSGLAGGVVISNTNGTLSLKLGNRNVQVKTNASTIVVIPGQSNAQVADIQVGDRVVAEFPGKDKNAPAAALLDIPKDYKVNNLRLGAVLKINGNRVALRTRNGNQVITTNASTVVLDVSSGKPAIKSLSDLKARNAVLVIGKPDGKAFNGQVIVIVSQDARKLLEKIKPKQPAATPTPNSGT